MNKPCATLVPPPSLVWTLSVPGVMASMMAAP